MVAGGDEGGSDRCELVAKVVEVVGLARMVE
jgi:hypothetical protein